MRLSTDCGSAFYVYRQCLPSERPPVRALFYEFDDPALYDHDSQFMVGSSLLVTPVLRPGETGVTGYFPSADGTTWVDWWTHKAVDTSKGDIAELDLPLGEIGVHIRSGSALLLYAKSGYTVKETKDSGYEILLVLDSKGCARGDAKVDDGVSLPGKRRPKSEYSLFCIDVSQSQTRLVCHSRFLPRASDLFPAGTTQPLSHSGGYLSWE